MIMIVHVCAQTPLEVCWDLLMDLDGPHAGVLWRPLFEYALLLLLLHASCAHRTSTPHSRQTVHSTLHTGSATLGLHYPDYPILSYTAHAAA